MCHGAGNADEMYVEVVSGLGEALVGNWPGAALSFVAAKSSLLAAAAAAAAAAEGSGSGEGEDHASHQPGDLFLPEGCIRVCGYPSKSAALLLAAERTGGGTVTIFRSDSNGEDLEG